LDIVGTLKACNPIRPFQVGETVLPSDPVALPTGDLNSFPAGTIGGCISKAPKVRNAIAQANGLG